MKFVPPFLLLVLAPTPLLASSTPIAGTKGTPPTEEGIPKRWGHLPPGSYYRPGAGPGTGVCDERLGCVGGRCWAKMCFLGDAGEADVEEWCDGFMYWGEC
jgi:hypothetical protein